MKKIIIPILILIFTILQSMNNTFAIEQKKAVSDSETQKELIESFSNVNQYTDTFFTQKKYLTEEELKEAKKVKNKFYSEGKVIPNIKSLPPLKKMRLKMYAKKHPESKVTSNAEEIPINPNETLVLNCDYMEYFAERTELEATGGVVLKFPQNDTTLKADKLIYNQSSNVIKAIDNVVVISGGQEMKGDYLLIDMNEENAFMDKPVTDFRQIHCIAKKGFMYGDKIIQEQGGMFITDHLNIDMRSMMFGPDLDTMVVAPEDKSYFMKEAHGSKFKIKTNDIIINSKKEHDTVQLKHATIYFNDKKVGTVPGITVHTNKNKDYVEANYPEFGTMTNMGMFLGPGFVFDTPRGSTLKLLPILNYQSGAEDTDHMFGFGGIAKYKSATNKTDIAYGTTNKTFLMRGMQYLDDNLVFQYGSNMYLDDWFLGFRMPRLLGELVYRESFRYNDFLAKDKDLLFTHRISAGYIQDGVGGLNAPKLGEDGVGTLRAKYMAEAIQTLYKFNDETKDTINARLDLVSQASMGMYGTGDTQFIGRIGPRIHTQYKRWMQDAGYFMSTSSDNTPLLNYDRYMYGRSNAYVRESYRLCKYLTISWLGSLNLSNDAPDGVMLQENAFFFGIGPDDVRLNIGYDIRRQQSFVTMAMHLDAKGTSLTYDKLVIKNPDTLNKNPKGDETYFDPGASKTESEVKLKDGLEKKIEHAEVVDVVGEEK